MTLEERVAELTLVERVAHEIAGAGNSSLFSHYMEVARDVIAMCREVRPLEWQDDDGEFVALRYHVRPDERYVLLDFEDDDGKLHMSEHQSVASAKAAAETHHQERVRGMLK